MSMFGSIFDDLRTAISSGDDFWSSAIKLAAPTAAEIIAGKKSSSGSTGSSALEKYEKLNSLSAGYVKSEDVSSRSQSYKSEAAKAATDPAAIRAEYIMKLKAYAEGTD